MKNLWKRPLNQNIKDRKSIFIECKCVLTMHLKHADHGWCVMINSQLESSPHQEFQGETRTSTLFENSKIIFELQFRNFPSFRWHYTTMSWNDGWHHFWAFTARTPNRHQEPGWSRWKRSGGLGGKVGIAKTTWNTWSKGGMVILFGQNHLEIRSGILTYNCCTSISWSSYL